MCDLSSSRPVPARGGTGEATCVVAPGRAEPLDVAGWAALDVFGGDCPARPAQSPKGWVHPHQSSDEPAQAVPWNLGLDKSNSGLHPSGIPSSVA